MPFCRRTSLEVHMIYDTKKFSGRFDPSHKNFKFCEFWDTHTGHCSKDRKKCHNGRPVTGEK